MDNQTNNKSCKCTCHKETYTVLCCHCYTLKKSECDCKKRKHCCGESEKKVYEGLSDAPGWKQGDKPPKNPFEGAKNDEDRFNIFKSAVMEMTLSGKEGPKFGARKDEYLPYLLVRANPGDRGDRPLHVPFWESPDIFIAPDMDAKTAPDIPTTIEGLGKAGVKNTLWAHVWNLGLSPAYNVRVEFYWFNPTLGFNQSAANFIGATEIELGNRYSGKAHKIVKCPESWVPTFLNGGHECLVVRCFEVMTDSLTPEPWNAGADRHVGQRNIHVAEASSPAVLSMKLSLGCGAPSGIAEIEVIRVKPANIPWLSILKGKVDHGIQDADKIDQSYGFLNPYPIGSGPDISFMNKINPIEAQKILQKFLKFERTCDELEIFFFMYIDGLKKNEYAIYRIQQRMNNILIGGYTAIARKV